MYIKVCGILNIRTHFLVCIVNVNRTGYYDRVVIILRLVLSFSIFLISITPINSKNILVAEKNN